MSRPKMVSEPRDGGGEAGPGLSGACIPWGAGQRPAPRDSRLAPRARRAPFAVPAAGGASRVRAGRGAPHKAGRGRGPSWTDRAASWESRGGRPSPSAVFPLRRVLWASRCCAAVPRGPVAWPRPVLHFSACGSKANSARLSFPFGFSCVHTAPFPKSQTCFRAIPWQMAGT